MLPAFVAAVLVACGTPDPRVAEPAAPLGSRRPPSARVRRSCDATSPSTRAADRLDSLATPDRDAETRASGPLPPIVVPADAIYVCVVDSAGTRRQTVIEFVPKVHQLCRRHPELGPCQYERNACRGAGGRVFAATGQEITMATEAEYDRKVMRVRFRAN